MARTEQTKHKKTTTKSGSRPGKTTTPSKKPASPKKTDANVHPGWLTPQKCKAKLDWNLAIMRSKEGGPGYTLKNHKTRFNLNARHAIIFPGRVQALAAFKGVARQIFYWETTGKLQKVAVKQDITGLVYNPNHVNVDNMFPEFAGDPDAVVVLFTTMPLKAFFDDFKTDLANNIANLNGIEFIDESAPFNDATHALIVNYYTNDNDRIIYSGMALFTVKYALEQGALIDGDTVAGESAGLGFKTVNRVITFTAEVLDHDNIMQIFASCKFIVNEIEAPSTTAPHALASDDDGDHDEDDSDEDADGTD